MDDVVKDGETISDIRKYIGRPTKAYSFFSADYDFNDQSISVGVNGFNRFPTGYFNYSGVDKLHFPLEKYTTLLPASLRNSKKMRALRQQLHEIGENIALKFI